jgi:hypothetical protein
VAKQEQGESEMARYAMTSLIEYVHAWAAENNVQFNDNY